MALDYRRLLDGLNACATMADRGVRGLPVINVLIVAVQDAAGAAGATFTEYDANSGRCVAATGRMTWALGQPVAAEFVEPEVPARAWYGRVDVLPVPIAEPLLGRGLHGMAGHPVTSGGKVVGAVHLYFVDSRIDSGDALLAAIGAATHTIARLYPGRAAEPFEGETDRDLFLAVTGHELRTPATVIKGYANMLADRWDALTESDRREATQVLAQRADELAKLVERLLSVSGGLPGTAWLARAVPFNLAEVVARAAGEMPTELRRTVRVELPHGLPLAYGDPASLPSILAELVTNASRHATEADVIELQAGADERTVFIHVCDRGVGIAPEHVERAFERFWQAGPSGRPRTGVGLGLYLVRRLVERQNGWVSLRPRDGGGTVAEVRLPRADGPVRPSASGEA
jgi:signal transduction histidine kinase